MLASKNLMGFVVTKDYDAARGFYEGKLGFEFLSLDQYAMVMKAGKSMIRIVRLRDFRAAQYTVLGWELENIEETVRWLTERGVVFEKYPFVQDRELGVWTAPNGDKVAWFKDPEGNVLSVSQHSGAPVV